MTKILNITNGDCAVNVMQLAAIDGDFLAWRDVLHDGPVPSGFNFNELSEVRAQFIIEQQWGEPKHIKDSFTLRDETLQSSLQFERIILWFEHDLYDQLQLLQILDWFYQHKSSSTNLSIICEEQYLGTLTPEALLLLKEREQPVSHQQLMLAHKAWAAFRADTPEQWCSLLNTDTSALPFLKGAILRLLEEYPSYFNGLSRTAHSALNIINNGEYRAGRTFNDYQQTEQRVFLGDSSFCNILKALLNTQNPLISIAEGQQLSLPFNQKQKLSITPLGKAVLSGKTNWLEHGSINRWIGGVHLTSDHIWYWDSVKQQLIAHV